MDYIFLVYGVFRNYLELISIFVIVLLRNVNFYLYFGGIVGKYKKQ